ncbi:MAG: hypothetical protein H6835_19870 [Planctomycetes bacterium]|nr:hypothetical protein [Planctomycetota bacterium]
MLRRLASPTMSVAAAGAALLTGTLWDTMRVLQKAHQVHLAAGEARAAIAAETVLAGGGEFASWSEHEVAGVRVAVRSDATGYRVRCESDGVRREYAAQWLAGGGPSVLGRRRWSPDPVALARLGGGEPVEASQFPQLDAKVLVGAAVASQSGGFVRDAGIALQWLDRGTDRDDFVWRGLGDGGARQPGRDGLLVVPGHLWVEPGEEPLLVPLDEDLVVVVQGNIYLGRSLAVRGNGRLLLVAAEARDATLFVDADGDGHWSAGERLLSGARFAGPVEGAGSVYLGLPGRRSAPIQCAAGLVVAGQLHVRVDAEVRGPLCLANGVTDLGGDGRSWRLGDGEWTYRPGRERIPGFATSGEPRPGLLRSILQQTLYPGPAAR